MKIQSTSYVVCSFICKLTIAKNLLFFFFQSSIRDYLVHFEPLVVETLKIFSTTSSITLQERCLFLMVQLLFLKVPSKHALLKVHNSLCISQVRYDLLDCNRVFLEAARRLVSLMETGSVAGGEQLVPHLFQFLVMLAQDSSKLVNIPEVASTTRIHDSSHTHGALSGL